MSSVDLYPSHVSNITLVQSRHNLRPLTHVCKNEITVGRNFNKIALSIQCWTTHETYLEDFIKQEAFEKCWAHSPLRAAARPFTRCRYCHTRASMSTTTTTTTTTTTRDGGDHYGPIEWAQQIQGAAKKVAP